MSEESLECYAYKGILSKVTLIDTRYDIAVMIKTQNSLRVKIALAWKSINIGVNYCANYLNLRILIDINNLYYTMFRSLREIDINISNNISVMKQYQKTGI